MTKAEYTTVDEYLELYDGEVKKRLAALRKTIRSAAPEATERISWGMPTYTQNGDVVHFAAATHHIGFYPGAAGVEAFRQRYDEMGLKAAKGTVQMPNAKPLPLELVAEVTRFRVGQNARWAAEKAAEKAAKKKK